MEEDILSSILKFYAHVLNLVKKLKGMMIKVTNVFSLVIVIHQRHITCIHEISL